MEILGIPPRRLGALLLAFGLLGVVLAGVAALGLLGGAIASRDLDDRLAIEQAQLATTLRRTSASLGKVASAMDDAATTLGTSRDAVADARVALDALAGASDELATALDLTLLGQRPFAAPAARFAALAASVRAFSDDAARLAGDLADNQADAGVIAAEVAALEVRLDGLATRLEAYDGVGRLADILFGGLLLAGLVAAWIAIAGGLCAAAGWRMRRAGDPAPHDVASPGLAPPAPPPATPRG